MCLRNGISWRQVQVLRVLYKALVSLPLVHIIYIYGWSFTCMKQKKLDLFFRYRKRLQSDKRCGDITRK